MKVKTQKPSLLIVDDDATNLKYGNEILKDDYKVYLAPSGKRALLFLESKLPDLILLDVSMPDMNGYELIERIKQNPLWSNIPVIFLTAMEGREQEQEALELGAVDYIVKPISAGIVKARVALHIELEQYRKKLEDIVELRTSQLLHTQDVILDVLASVASARDSETGAHIKRTTHYVQLLCENMKQATHPFYHLEDEDVNHIVKSSKLHDIGKVAIPDKILLKPAQLSENEFEIIKQHTSHGVKILDNAMQELVEKPVLLEVAREIIISHHEKWDGSGYPKGLKAERIPLCGRIMAIADVYDALISSRPYKPHYTHQDAVEIIAHQAGTHFDPYLVELSMCVIEKFQEVAEMNCTSPKEQA